MGREKGSNPTTPAVSAGISEGSQKPAKRAAGRPEFGGLGEGRAAVGRRSRQVVV